MPYKDPEKRKEYYQKNKEKIKERTKKYKEKNKQLIKEKNRLYTLKNKEKRKEYMTEYINNNKEKIKEYRQTEECIKITRISRWKFRGIKCEDWDKLYNIYLSQSNCEECGIELTYDKRNTTTTKCLDHDHETGEFRNILCNLCNVKRG